MKKLTTTLFMALLGVFSLQAGQFCDDEKNVTNEISEHLCKAGQSIAEHVEQSYDTTEDIINNIRNRFRSDISNHPGLRSKSSPITTNTIMYQYTTDGWLQHVAVYADSAIGTNMAGPRKGFQIIMASNLAIMDTCNEYKEHKNHFTHKYSWGEVNTYENYQTVTFK